MKMTNELEEKYNDFYFIFSFVPLAIGVGTAILLQYVLPSNVHRFVSLAIGAFIGGASPFVINNIAAARKGQVWIKGFHIWLNKRFRRQNFMKTLRGIIGVIYIVALGVLGYGIYLTLNS